MLLFYFGCCLGSFLMVVATRLPIGEDFLVSRSHCHHCQKTLHFYELIPIFSIFFMRFRCSACQKRIPITYLLVECLYGFLFFIVFKSLIGSIALVYFIWITMAFLLSLTDLFYWIVEPKILYPFGCLLWSLLYLFDWSFYPATLIFLLLVAFLIYFFLQAYFGFGDMLLLLFWGPWFTIHQLFILLFVASLSGLIISYLYSRLTQQSVNHLPFVPFLSLGLLFLLFF